MNPLPVVVSVLVVPKAIDVAATGVSRAWFINTAAGVPVQFSVSAGDGATQKMSPHVSNALLPSGVLAAVTPTNDESFSTPQEALIVFLNGTGTLCTSSTTESIAPAVPQYRLKSAARYTLAVTASRSRIGNLRTVL